MRDNELYIAIIAELNTLLDSQDLGDVKVSQGYPKTQQSASINRSIFIHKVTNPQVGTGYIYKGNKRTQQNLRRSTFQFNALVEQDITDITSLTATDILTTAADMIQSYDGLRNLRKNGVNIERVTDVREVNFVNEKGENESSPSFDLTVNYEHIYETNTPIISGINCNLESI